MLDVAVVDVTARATAQKTAPFNAQTFVAVAAKFLCAFLLATD